MSRKHRPIIVPEAREALDQFKGQVMAQEGYCVGIQTPDQVKYENSPKGNKLSAIQNGRSWYDQKE